MEEAGKSADEIKAFETNAQTYVKSVLKEIKNMQVFCGKYEFLYYHFSINNTATDFH